MAFAMTSARRLFFPAVVLLSSLPVYAQTAANSAAVPTRSLLDEMTQAESGSSAYIHTHYGTGTGLLLDSEGEVVTARHNVLTPDGRIAAEIGVGVPEPPLNNIMEARSVAVAQDPVHDLVLLRITGEAARAATARREGKGSAIAAVAPCEPGPPAHEAHTDRHARTRHAEPQRRVAAAPYRAIRSVRSTRSGSSVSNIALVRTRASARAPVRLHVVWDGPLTGTR